MTWSVLKSYRIAARWNDQTGRYDRIEKPLDEQIVRRDREQLEFLVQRRFARDASFGAGGVIQIADRFYKVAIVLATASWRS